MPSALSSPAVTQALVRLRASGDAEDEPAKRRVRAREARLGSKVYGSERADLYAGAPLSIAADVGELLHLLVLARRPHRIVEFGASLGVSTIYLAAALQDIGVGSLITTELVPEKARLAQQHLSEAGLGQLVEMRVGDARDTLAALDEEVELLFLDGWNDMYLAVLELLEPLMPTGALVIADMSKDDPELTHYHEHVHRESNGYHSVDLPLDDGVVVSVRARPEGPRLGSPLTRALPE